VPKKSSFAELYRRAVKFPGPSLRLAGLESALEATEQQLDTLKNQYELRLNARLKREAQSMHPDDIDDERYAVSGWVDDLFPKIFRGGFVLSLWSVFEACVKDLAEYTKRERKIPFGLQDLRAGDFLEQTDKFFQGALDLRVFPDKSVRKSLEELKGLRNALVHHDGNTAEVPKSLLPKGPSNPPSAKVRVYADLHHKYAVPSEPYARESLSLVTAYLQQLSEQVYAKLHAEPAEDDA
jgi:hypothetical protein